MIVEKKYKMTFTEKIQAAFAHAEKVRPKVGGFPYLAECLRQAGAQQNIWQLPSAQSIFLSFDEAIVIQNQPLLTGFAEVPAFDEAELVRILRLDQAGESAFPEFLQNTWQAGVVSYTVDFGARTCSYYGVRGEVYVETYPEVEI